MTSIQPSTGPIIEILFARLSFGRGAGITDIALFFGARQLLHGIESFQGQLAGRDGRAFGVFFDLAVADRFDQAADRLKLPQGVFVGSHLADRQGVSVIEMIEGLAEIDARETRAEDLATGFADQVARDAFGADLFAFVFQLDLSGDRGDRGVNIADPGSDYGLVVMQCAPLGVRHDALHHCDRQALADAGAFINAFIVTRDERDLFDDFADGFRDQKSKLVMIRIIAVIAVAIGPGLLLRDLDAFFYRSGVMSLNLRADPVLERRDNFAARRVIFGVGREDQQHVKWQPDRITLNLHVSFLHDVEQSDLNLSGQVRQFVDGDNAAVGAGQQAVMDRQLVREQVSSARRLDRVNVADDVRDGHVGRRQLFNISRVTINPVNRRIVALFGDYLFAVSADRMERIIVDL